MILINNVIIVLSIRIVVRRCMRNRHFMTIGLCVCLCIHPLPHYLIRPGRRRRGKSVRSFAESQIFLVWLAHAHSVGIPGPFSSSPSLKAGDAGGEASVEHASACPIS